MNRSIIVLLICSLIACTPSQPTNMPDDPGIPWEQLNQEISLSAPKGWNTFKLDQSVTLEIVNKSKENIQFDANFGTRMFIYEKDGWKEVSNGMINVSSGDIILRPIKTDPTGSVANSVLPELGDNRGPTVLRVFVFGYVVRENTKTDQKVGAFIDVNLAP